ncbi:hypothetical protein MHY87_06725 [Microvirga sp. ACRRW]|uniref:hypothetical protein n=1 Tax=Microvirga sp. ACRRW TaxID=2918205 RepID=UPI001EF52732|nr:hypothetical protein [Microvirga sp. ACRRW]MCG7392596.1 hypothetical protein [Microvirga sp. ACRRW]
MSINWLVLALADEDLQIPTYGLYGGPGYSGGVLLKPGDQPSFAKQPIDPLDALFSRHDQAVLDATSREEARADLQLIKGIMALPDDAVSSEGDLYAGAAILAMLGRIIHSHPEFLIGFDVAKAVDTAADLIEQGSIRPDPQERAALVAWLQETSAALAERDHPLSDFVADKILDLADRLGDGTLTFALGDNAFTFPEGEAKVLLIEAIADAMETGGIADLVASHHQDANPPILEALHHKLSHHLDWDFAF